MTSPLALPSADLERLRAAGIYDPRAEDAERQRALVERLVAHGLSVDDLIAACRAGALVVTGFDRIMRPGARRTTAEVAAASGVPAGDLERLWRALGFPDAPPDHTCWTEGDVDLVQFFRALADLVGVERALHVARVAGTAMSRVAEAEIALLRSQLEAPMQHRHFAWASILGRYDDVLQTFLPGALRALDTLHRSQLLHLGARYAMALAPSEHNLVELVIGFADLTGSTALVQRLDLPALDRALALFEERSSDCVAAEGATLVKRLGDGAMFVTPDAAAACRVALALVDAFAGVPEVPPVRVGLAAGRVAALRGDFFGPAVHLAARLVDAAAPGEVLAADEVRERAAWAGDRLAFTAAGERRLAGFAQPLQLVAVTRR